MIPLSPIIRRLREQCPSFGNRVGSTAALATALDVASAGIAVPHAFVIPMNGQDFNAYFDPQNPVQDLRDNFVVVVCVDNAETKGIPGAGEMDTLPVDRVAALLREVQTAFMGWRLSPRFEPIRYFRDAHLGMTNSRLWHQFEFTTGIVLNPTVNPDIEAGIDEAVNGVRDVPPWDGSRGQTLEEIIVGAYPKAKEGEPMDSIIDWMPASGPRDTPEETQARIAAADARIPVNPAVTGGTSAEVWAAAEHGPAFVPGPLKHGVYVEEEGGSGI